jgi:predicted PurR-regulated permease PerM
MTYLTTKRWKLAISILTLGLSFFIIVFFVHDPFFNSFIKSTAQDIPDYYKEEIYRIIAKHPEMTKEVREELWRFGGLKEGSKPDEVYNFNNTFPVSLYIISISDYVKISYIIVGFFIMCVTAILTKWYTSDNSNLFISERKMSIEKLVKKIEENMEKGKK